MNGVVYKWRIKDCIYGYLTDRVGGDPFISSTKENDEQISKAVNSFDEEQYKTHYEALCTLLRQKGYNVQMLDYKYYYGVDDTSCGLLKYAGEAYKGEAGKDGTSVVDVMALGDFNGFSVLRFTFSNGTHKDVPIRTPKDGVSPENGVDGADGNTLALIMELDHEKAEFQAEIDAASDKIRQEMRELWDTSRDALTSFQIDLSALTHNSGYIQTVMDELAGLERKIYGYIDISALTKTEFEQVFAPYSGYVETLGTYVNSALQTVVLFENRIDMAEAQLHTAMSYYDNIAGVLNKYVEKYDAVNGRYDQIVAQLTDNGTISFTDIFQTARSVGMILSSDSSITGSDNLYYDYGDTLVAGIIAKINDSNSGTEMQIRADKIYLLGETVASGLSALDIWVGGGNTHFASDGSGYIANHYIEWDKWGNVTIQGQLSVEEIIDTLGNSMIQFGTNGGSKAQTMFSPDGSGWLSGGAIYWDENGHLTISKDVTIEGQLSISQMVDGIRKETVCFGDTESTAVTIFRPDGSGQLAGGAISWDVDGRLVIANDLYVTGSIYQGFLNYANGADVNFGNFTSNFYADGDFNLANGALIYDSDTSTLTIKGNVVIEGQDDGIGNYIESYLKTENLYIGENKTTGEFAAYFGSDGSGYIAHSGITWTNDGKLAVSGKITAQEGKIGPFSIDKYSLYSGAKPIGGETDPTNAVWKTYDFSQDAAFFSNGRLRIQHYDQIWGSDGHSVPSRLSCDFGLNANNGNTSEHDFYNVGYILRKTDYNFNTTTFPERRAGGAVLRIEDISPNLRAIYTIGGISIGRGTLYENVFYKKTNGTEYLDLNKSRNFLFYCHTNNIQVYFPTYAELEGIFGPNWASYSKHSYFKPKDNSYSIYPSIEVTITSHYNSNAYITFPHFRGDNELKEYLIYSRSDGTYLSGVYLKKGESMTFLLYFNDTQPYSIVEINRNFFLK